MDLQPAVSMTPVHAFAAVSAAPPQQRWAWEASTIQLPATTFSPLTEVTSPSNLQVVAWLELHGSSGQVQPLLLSTFFFFFFFLSEGSCAATTTSAFKLKKREMVSRPLMRCTWTGCPIIWNSRFSRTLL